MLKKIMLVLCVCLLCCVGGANKTAAAENKYSVELSGRLIDTINNLEQRIADLETKVATLENGCVSSNVGAGESKIVELEISPITNESSFVPAIGGATEDKPTEAPTVVEAPSAVESAPLVAELTPPLAGQVISSGAVLINEFVSDPVTGDKEWVEIYNNSVSVIDLTNWTIEEGSGLKTKLSGGLGFGAYMVFDRSSLNNDGDIISLKDASGQIIDQVAYGNWNDGNVADNALVATKGQSVGRSGQSFFVTTTITKAVANIITPPMAGPIIEPAVTIVMADKPAPVVAVVVDPVFAPQDSGASTDEPVSIEQPTVVEALSTPPTAGSTAGQFSDLLVVNEILPDPEGDDIGEWIEIYNTGAAPVNLYKWQIDDIDGGSKPYTVDEPLIIQAFGYMIFSRKQTAIVLNNDKDSVRLIDPAGKVVSSINYSAPAVGQSYARFLSCPAVGGVNWQWSAKTTAGAVNELPPLLAGLSVEPATTDDNPAHAVVKKTSSLIKTASAQVISTNSAPIAIAAGEIGASLVGKLVNISGEIVDKTGRKLYIADDSGEAAIYFPTKLSDVNLAMFELGDKAMASGVIKKYKDELRIVARSAQDFVITEKSAAAAKLFSNNQPRKLGWFAWLIAGSMAAAGAVYWFISKRKVLA